MSKNPINLYFDFVVVEVQLNFSILLVVLFYPMLSNKGIIFYFHDTFLANGSKDLIFLLSKNHSEKGEYLPEYYSSIGSVIMEELGF